MACTDPVVTYWWLNDICKAKVTAMSSTVAALPADIHKDMCVIYREMLVTATMM